MQRSLTSQNFEKKRNKVEEHTLSYFKSYYETTAIKTLCVCVYSQ